MQLNNKNTLGITLNVGEQEFRTSYDTLIKSEYFKICFEEAGITRESMPFTMDLDRRPKIFEHVLSLLINPDYHYPIKYLNELPYFHIKYEIEKQVVEEPNFVKLNETSMLNLEYVKYIRYDPDNDMYEFYLSAKLEESQHKIAYVFPGMMLHKTFKREMNRFRIIPHSENTKRYEFIKIDDALFLNWCQIKYIRHEDDNSFKIYFSSEETLHQTFIVTSDKDLHSYLMSALQITGFRQNFIRFNKSLIINYDAVKHVRLTEKGFDLHLSYKHDSSHKIFCASQGTLPYNYFNAIMDSRKRIPIISDASNRPNFVRLDNTTIINWNQVKWISYGSIPKIYLTSKKESDRRFDVIENKILSAYLKNKITDISFNSSQRNEANIVGFNNSILLNLNTLKWINYYHVPNHFYASTTIKFDVSPYHLFLVDNENLQIIHLFKRQMNAQKVII